MLFMGSYVVEGADDALELLEASDMELLKDRELLDSSQGQEFNISGLEEIDDLDSLKSDTESMEGFRTAPEMTKEQLIEKQLLEGDKDSTSKDPVKEEILVDEKGVSSEGQKVTVFDVGPEEKKLLEFSKFVESKIPSREWNEIAVKSKEGSYTVQEGDWLWKISQELFGSGFYYSKIWSLNPHIKNPHEIKPGMVLLFSTGDADSMPDVKLSEFAEDALTNAMKQGPGVKKTRFFDFSQFGSLADEPPWLRQREKLISQGVYFQYASVETYDDLVNASGKEMTKEYMNYTPPFTQVVIEELGDTYDEHGFDKSSRIQFKYKEGFYLNTFVTTNIVIDLGKIDSMSGENIFAGKLNRVFVEFDDDLKIKPGDQFSVYSPMGKVSHKLSDRSGYRYQISAEVKTIRKINQLWECLVTEVTGLVKRGDRLTTYMPKINKIVKGFSKRNIEGTVIGAFRDRSSIFAPGDVVYLDRGRADGVELGTVFETYGFTDRGTEKKISYDPAYKTGEVVVITLTDNFATGVISLGIDEISLGTLVVSKTLEQAAKASRIKSHKLLKGVKKLESDALDELDVELNLDDISENILDKAASVKLTEDELDELERQEREKSVIKDHEKDLRELERLESELIDAEDKLKQAKLDEDQLLENQNLDHIEKDGTDAPVDAFMSLNEIEKEVGRKYMEQDLNSKENPYGLTEFDLEEIDELLNTEQK